MTLQRPFQLPKNKTNKPPTQQNQNSLSLFLSFSHANFTMIPLSFLFLSFLSFLSLSLSQPPPPPPLRGTYIDCGSTVGSTIDGRQWVPDTNYINTGTPINLTTPVLVPTLSTVRSFPYQNNLHKKFCYDISVFRGAKYMVRTTYFYGGINGRDSPPVFDQMVDGALWRVVNTTLDYANGMSSYYEAVFVAKGRTMSVCIGVNSYTDSDPFISALELVILGDSLYNSTDFNSSGLNLISRHSFGYSGPIIRDQSDRFWEPFQENKSTPASNNNVNVSGFWNLPPSRIFDTVLTSNQSEPIEFTWPSVSLPNSTYYIALYFADNRDSSSAGSSVFDISLNGITYFKNLNVTKEGAAIFATRWPLIGATNVTLTPAAGSNIGPLINGGEIFSVLALGGRTHTRDVIALENIKMSLRNPPLDWNGDPCFPRQYSWTGVTCSAGSRIRVVTLNLTSMGLSGSLSPNISRLTALTGIGFGNNSLSGSIPDLSSLRMLEILHLEDNQFSGKIPSSLGNITGLRELFLQNNNLTGQIPSSLSGKPGLDLRTSPGNQLLSPPPV